MVGRQYVKKGTCIHKFPFRLSDLFLMPILPQSFLSLVSGHLVSLSLFSARHVSLRLIMENLGSYFEDPAMQRSFPEYCIGLSAELTVWVSVPTFLYPRLCEFRFACLIIDVCKVEHCHLIRWFLFNHIP